MPPKSVPKSVNELIHTLRYGDAADRRAAMAELAHRATESAEAIPDLIAVLRDEDPSLRFDAATALACMGPAAVKPLIEAMLDADVDFRRAVIAALGGLGPDAAAAVPVLRAARGDPQFAVEADAALALIQPPFWKTLRPHLVRTLPLALLLTGGVAVVAGAVATLSGLADLMRPDQPLALTLGAAIGLLGGFLGSLIGGITRGRAGAVVGLLVLGIAGYLIGVIIGGWVGSLLGPLGR